MGNPVYQRYTVAGTVLGPQAPVNLDWLPFGAATLGVFIVDGAAEYSVEGTLDDLVPSQDGGRVGAANPARWFPIEDMPAGTAVSAYAAIWYPFLFVRLNITAITGTVEFKVVQSITGRF